MKPFSKDTVAETLIQLKWSRGNCTTVEECERIEAKIAELVKFVHDNQVWNGRAWVWTEECE